MGVLFRRVAGGSEVILGREGSSIIAGDSSFATRAILSRSIECLHFGL